MHNQRQTFRIRPRGMQAMVGDQPVGIEDLSLGGARLSIVEGVDLMVNVLELVLEKGQRLRLGYEVLARDATWLRVEFHALSVNDEQALSSFIMHWQQQRACKHKDRF